MDLKLAYKDLEWMDEHIDTYISSLKMLKEYDGRYDEIYAMHGTVPVKPDLIDKLIGGAEQIRGGTAEGKKVDMFGNEVMLYKIPYAGFLCEVKEVL